MDVGDRKTAICVQQDDGNIKFWGLKELGSESQLATFTILSDNDRQAPCKFKNDPIVKMLFIARKNEPIAQDLSERPYNFDGDRSGDED